MATAKTLRRTRGATGHLSLCVFAMSAKTLTDARSHVEIKDTNTVFSIRFPMATHSTRKFMEVCPSLREIRINYSKKASSSYVQGSSIRPFPGCENAAGKLRQKW